MIHEVLVWIIIGSCLASAGWFLWRRLRRAGRNGASCGQGEPCGCGDGAGCGREQGCDAENPACDGCPLRDSCGR